MTTEKCDALWCDLHDTTPWNPQCSYEGTERCFSNMKIRHPKDKRLKRKELEEINEWLEAKIGFLKLEIDELEEKYVEIKKAAVAINLAIKIDSEKSNALNVFYLYLTFKLEIGFNFKMYILSQKWMYFNCFFLH